MFDLVISAGDSFTFGAELKSDNSVNPSPYSWANLVAQRIGKHHINVARSGRSNSYIARHVLHEIQEAISNGILPNKIFVQVMWTFTNRSEFAISIPTAEYDSPWMFFTPYSHVDETESTWFKSVNRELPTWKDVYTRLKSSYNKNKNLGIVDFAKHYDRLVKTELLNDSYTSMKEVILLQNTLLLYEIPYLFTYVSQDVMYGLFTDATDSDGSKYLHSLRSFNREENWFRFPGDYQTYVGFDDWAKANKYEYATSHPLELAHIDAAQLVYEYIKSKEQYNDI